MLGAITFRDISHNVQSQIKGAVRRLFKLFLLRRELRQQGIFGCGREGRAVRLFDQSAGDRKSSEKRLGRIFRGSGLYHFVLQFG